MPKPTKGELNVQFLENARCSAQWDEIPNLVRKVRKHTTDRECLATTAETEHKIILASLKERPGSRPATAIPPTELDAATLAPRLLEVLENESKYPEERYQARVCVGWLYWAVGEYELASEQLSLAISGSDAELGDVSTLGEWTRVCMLKAAYLKANCLSRDDRRLEALTVFESALGPLADVWNGYKGRQQLSFWAELFLTEYCMLQARTLEAGEKSLADPNSLTPLRCWAKYWESSTTQGTPLKGGHGFRGAIPRRRIWGEYYTALSGILQNDLPYPPGNLTAITKDTSARNQLRIELKKVEAAYEGLLLTETPFPRADEEREEVEHFVNTAMANWAVLGGRDWHEHDLGPGGKEGLSRGILDILYRAATKTFHSTSILRSLFTVHLSVAEFDLAFHAFDSYLDIVTKGTARIDKTGHVEPSLDDDATVLQTISQAIIALCKYGFHDAAEKSYNLGVQLEQMLQKLPAPLPNTEENISTLGEETADGTELHPRISSWTNALAWQAIGLSQAQWARYTFDTAVRSEMQSKSIGSFQKSLSPQTGNPTDVRTLFTLGIVLAEQRQLSAAIDIVKAALMSNKKAGDTTLETGTYWRERSLIPLWHLLALLMSARQDFVMASRACEGAFEQFDDPTVLFGSQSLQGGFRSEHLNELEAKAQTLGLVDEMDDVEKEGIIEVKMTQLALVELLEGPEVAVNACQELLVLYTRLFGSTQKPPTGQKSMLDVPKSSAGTVKSVRGSIFGSRSDRNSRKPASAAPSDMSSLPERPLTTQTSRSTTTAAPTIQVTDDQGENGISQRPSTRGRRSDSARRSSLKKPESDTSQRRAASTSATAREPTVVDGEDYFTPATEIPANDRPEFFSYGSKSSIGREASFSRGRGLLRFDSNISARSAPAADITIDTLSPPSALPVVQFPDDQAKRQQQIILVRVWLLIAAFYRRAGMVKDTVQAIQEAKSIVDTLEADIAKDTSGLVRLSFPGWGGKKSADELWSDVHAEAGYLALVQDLPYKARAHFEEALLRSPNHPQSILGLSNILLDIYSENLLPDPAVPKVAVVGAEPGTLPAEDAAHSSAASHSKKQSAAPALPNVPIGLKPTSTVSGTRPESQTLSQSKMKPATSTQTNELPAPWKATSLPLVDRLAARDRAYGLLSSLTRLGTGWNNSEAWFALARAYEESSQADKAKDALWWCVELEEAKGIRPWSCVGAGGYVL
ncbi:putative filamentation protein Rhf1 [Microdochium trichocladiopsis]|uniref:Filamentation protein Rhf1 n=1 Tax=Microdochium trichocladiopsis TaxID=1682393 RepID=A0A9P9BUZ7_9PEZI|nr:putative filamentation protein Rhf1 [Microdochium trichocladiopsis]KAH7037979.1 putative filamentation protein Rhf1 [Microdochium trichocladiopsis]